MFRIVLALRLAIAPLPSDAPPEDTELVEACSQVVEAVDEYQRRSPSPEKIDQWTAEAEDVLAQVRTDCLAVGSVEAARCQIELLSGAPDGIDLNALLSACAFRQPDDRSSEPASTNEGARRDRGEPAPEETEKQDCPCEDWDWRCRSDHSALCGPTQQELAKRRADSKHQQAQERQRRAEQAAVEEAMGTPSTVGDFDQPSAYEERERRLVGWTAAFGATSALSTITIGIVVGIYYSDLNRCLDSGECSSVPITGTAMAITGSTLGVVNGLSLIGLITSGLLLRDHRMSGRRVDLMPSGLVVRF